VPRRFNGLRSDQGAYSRTFRKEDAAIYMSLAQAGLLCSTGDQSGDASAGMSFVSFVRIWLTECTDLLS
jgi:hypothetical protein